MAQHTALLVRDKFTLFIMCFYLDVHLQHVKIYLFECPMTPSSHGVVAHLGGDLEAELLVIMLTYLVLVLNAQQSTGGWITGHCLSQCEHNT